MSMYGNTNSATPFGSGPFGNSPFGSQNIDQLQQQYQQQLETLNRMKNAPQQERNNLEEISKRLGMLDKESQPILYESPEYRMARQLYEASFLQFISNKFSQEYVGQPEGKEAAMGLLKVIKNSKDKIAYQTKVKNDRINKMLEMLEQDPEIRKSYDELTGVKKQTAPIDTPPQQAPSAKGRGRKQQIPPTPSE